MQLIKKSIRKKKQKKINKAALENCPQKRGFCEAFFIKSPKKPNSAKRKCVKVSLVTHKKIHCYLPGKGFSLQKYSELLIRGGRKKDLPGIKYTGIRGKYAFGSLTDKKTARSKYGIARPVDEE
jgi:small subunit ribosomal protein S12